MTNGRILFIFTPKSIILTVAGATIGFIFYYILKAILHKTLYGLIAVGICAFIGYSIGTFKMPETNSFEITRKTGGERIDDVILRAIKFKMKKNRIYVYKKEEK